MYSECFTFVEHYLNQNNGQQVQGGSFPFRFRIDHIRRVFRWIERLLEGAPESVRKEELFTAAIFHDVGYGNLQEGEPHAQNSAGIFRDYAREHEFTEEKTDFICYLIENHSNKNLLTVPDTPLELILLMEADLLDETGAMAIAWDCMAEGGKERQSFRQTLDHIKAYSGKILMQNPMVTARGKAFWEEKQKLTGEYIRQLERDEEMAKAI